MKNAKKKESGISGNARSGVRGLLVDLNGQLQGYLKSLKTTGSIPRSG